MAKGNVNFQRRIILLTNPPSTYSVPKINVFVNKLLKTLKKTGIVTWIDVKGGHNVADFLYNSLNRQ